MVFGQKIYRPNLQILKSSLSTCFPFRWLAIQRTFFVIEACKFFGWSFARAKVFKGKLRKCSTEWQDFRNIEFIVLKFCGRQNNRIEFREIYTHLIFKAHKEIVSRICDQPAARIRYRCSFSRAATPRVTCPLSPFKIERGDAWNPQPADSAQASRNHGPPQAKSSKFWSRVDRMIF